MYAEFMPVIVLSKVFSSMFHYIDVMLLKVGISPKNVPAQLN